MVNKESRSEVRIKKHMRVRNHLAGTADRPRLCTLRLLMIQLETQL